MRRRPIPDILTTKHYPEVVPVVVDISVDDQTSEAFGGSGTHLFALETPAAFTSTALTFQHSTDSGTTWTDVYYESTKYSLTVAPSHTHVVNPAVFAPLSLVRILTGTAEEADRTIKAIMSTS